MSRKSKTLLITLGVLILLGGGYYGSTIWKKKKPDSSSESYTPPDKIGNLEAFKLVKIESGGIVLERKDSAWELSSVEGEAPPEYDLDQVQIQMLTYSLTNVYVENTVEETPEDLSVYGLDKPSSRVMITDSDGETTEYILGDMAPSRNSYYAMQRGDPRVYTIASYIADSLHFTLDTIRNRSLFTAFDLSALAHFQLEESGKRIEISVKPESIPPYLASSFTSYLITSPYMIPRGVNSEALNTLLAPLSELRIVDFIDDHPLSLEPYGLDKPIKILLVTYTDSIDLEIGSRIDGKRYAKLAGAPGVFTLGGLEDIINAKPFDLTDKFPLLVNIDSVDHLTISGGEKPLGADFKNSGEDGEYFLNGRKTETKSFKTFYQAVIGLLMDAEYPAVDTAGPEQKTPDPAVNPENAETGNITIDYQLNNPPGGRASITLIPFNRDFYALRQEGTTEFLISRNQVRKIFETAENVAFEE